MNNKKQFFEDYSLWLELKTLPQKVLNSQSRDIALREDRRMHNLYLKLKLDSYNKNTFECLCRFKNSGLYCFEEYAYEIIGKTIAEKQVKITNDLIKDYAKNLKYKIKFKHDGKVEVLDKNKDSR